MTMFCCKQVYSRSSGKNKLSVEPPTHADCFSPTAHQPTNSRARQRLALLETSIWQSTYWADCRRLAWFATHIKVWHFETTGPPLTEPSASIQLSIKRLFKHDNVISTHSVQKWISGCRTSRAQGITSDTEEEEEEEETYVYRHKTEKEMWW